MKSHWNKTLRQIHQDNTDRFWLGVALADRDNWPIVTVDHQRKVREVFDNHDGRTCRRYARAIRRELHNATR